VEASADQRLFAVATRLAVWQQYVRREMTDDTGAATLPIRPTVDGGPPGGGCADSARRTSRTRQPAASCSVPAAGQRRAGGVAYRSPAALARTLGADQAWIAVRHAELVQATAASAGQG
jgi:hypothetical protein